MMMLGQNARIESRSPRRSLTSFSLWNRASRSGNSRSNNTCRVAGWVGPLCVVLAVLLTPSAAADGQSSKIDRTLASQYFSEAKALSDRDGGRLWGVELYGPMMFVEPQSRAVVANQADRDGYLEQEGDVFVGVLPPGELMGNTAGSWAGVEWTMLMWPLPRDAADRSCLMTHELWHRVQGDLGLPASGFANDHLDARNGRIWLRLEWRALAAALRGSGDARREAVKDALTFRAYRRSLFRGAAAEERSLEMHEGLAEYTGIRAGSDSDRMALARAVRNLKHGRDYDTFVRSFAYASGPAYGLLLDEASSGWQRKVRAWDDLGMLLRTALHVDLPVDLKAAGTERSKAYGADKLIAEEDHRDAARQDRAAVHRKRYVGGPVLTLPLFMMKIQFDPRSLEPLDNLGTVYPTATISDQWGTLNVTGGCLIRESLLGSSVAVPAPADPEARPLTGDGWTLELADGWAVAPGPREGAFRLIRK